MFREQIFSYFQDSRSLLLKDLQTGTTFSYKEALPVIKNFGSILNKYGIKCGDRVAVLLDNSAEFFLLYLACLLQRIVVCPINSKYNLKDINYCLSLSGAKKIVVNKEMKGLEVPFIHLDEFAPVTSNPNYANNITIGEEYQPDDLFSITFTSGTTGKPKAIGHKAETQLSNAHAFNRQTGNDKDQCMLHVMPMFYMAGILNTILCPVQAGGSVVIDASFGPLSPITFWKNFIENDCTTAWLSPTMIQSILKLDRNKELFPEIRNHADKLKIFSGTAPLTGKSKREFYEKYSVILSQSYGLSETLFVSVKNIGDMDFKPSVGTILDGIDIKFDNDGEILLDTNYMMAGYINSKGWFENEHPRIFRTGDLGKMVGDELYITGRKKELIIKGGENINPKEIENVILKLEFVENAAIVGFEDEFYGEDIAVFVVTKHTDEEKVRKAILKICKEQLKPSLTPSKIIFINEMPLTPTGKIQKKELSVN